MAGFKHRYLIVKIEGLREKKLTKTYIYKVILNSLRHNFGEYALGLIDTLEVIETYENLEIVIIRCNLLIYKYLCYCLIITGSIKESTAEERVKFSILLTSGILKRAKKRFLQIQEAINSPRN